MQPNELKKKLMDAYNNGTPLQKEYLQKSFGQRHLTDNVMERVTSYETACEELGHPIMTQDQFNIFPADQRQYMWSKHRVITFIQAMKEGVLLNYNNKKQEKHYGWADLETYGNAVPGSGFSLFVVVCRYSSSTVGARQSCLSNAQVKHLWTCLRDDMYVIMKDQSI